MSMFVHRCPACGHIEQGHDAAAHDCSAGTCRCDRGTVRFGPPESIPTFDPLTGAELPTVAQPGALLGPGFRACSCAECSTAVAGAR